MTWGRPSRLIRFLRFLCAAAFFLPVSLSARYVPGTLTFNIGTPFSFWGIMDRIISFLALAIISVAVTMFVAGAAMFAFSGVKEEYKSNGKNLMIGAVLSLAVVLGAYAILSTVGCFLSASCTLGL